MTDDEIRALRLAVADLTRHDGPFDAVEALCDDALKDRADLATARALLEDVEERTYDGQRIPVNLFYRITAFLHPSKDGA